LVRADSDRSGLLGAVAVLAAAVITTLIAWYPLSFPVRLINQFAAAIVPNSCPGVPGGFLNGLCAGAMGLLTMFGSVVALVLVFVFRKTLRRLLSRLARQLPDEAQFLVKPLIATVVFTMAWAGNAFHFFGRPGLVPDGLFPAVVGLMSYALLRWGPAVQRQLAGLGEMRGRLSTGMRLLVTLGITWLLSLLLTQAFHAPTRDQLVVVFGMVIAYVLLAPLKAEVSATASHASSREEGVAR
jgi:hypothetical protein